MALRVGKNHGKHLKILEILALLTLPNPALFMALDEALSMRNNATILDVGAGSNSLGLTYLYSESHRAQSINIWISIEGSEELVRDSEKNIRLYDSDQKILSIHHHVDGSHSLPIANHSIDVGLSRHMLMHLWIADLTAHIKDLRRVLKKNGVYIAAILNPAYEQFKRTEAHEDLLLNDQQYTYSFLPKDTAGNHFFTQYFKDTPTFEKICSTFFTITKKINCFPTTDEFRLTHSRYYMKETPMTLLYILEPLP